MNVAAWSGQFASEVYDTSSFGVTFRTSVHGLQHCAFTASGFLSDGSATNVSTFYEALSCGSGPAAVVLTAATGDSFSFNSNIEGLNLDIRIDDVSKLSVSGRSTGVITSVWNAS
jgi:hypothetical protein